MRKFYRFLMMGALLGSLSVTQAAESTWNIADLQQLEPVMAPEGNARAYQFYSMGYTSGDFYEDPSLATSIIINDNEIYVKNPLFDYTTNGWIKGTVEGDKAVFTFPQNIGTYLRQDPESYAYEYAPVYLFVCGAEEVFVENPEGDDFSYWTMEINQENQTIVMDLNADGSISWGNPDPQYMSDLYGIGGFILDGEELFWDKSAELYDKFEPLQYVNDAPPASANIEQWNYRDRYQYHIVNVATEGNNLWIQNPDPTSEGGWLKGTAADGKVTFASEQYIGINDNYRRTSFFLGSRQAKIYLDDEDFYIGSKPQDELTLLYDADKKSITSADSTDEFLFIDKKMPASDFSDPELIYYHLMAQVINPELYIYENLGYARPANPEITGYDTYTYTGWGGAKVTEVELLFATPNKDLNGQTIPMEDCYYNIFINGELFSLWNDEFLKLPLSLDGISDIPYSLNEDYGLFTHSLLHDIFLTSEGMETVGVQGFYKAGNGKTYETDKITLTLKDGKITVEAGSDSVESILTSTTVKSREYFTLQGQRIAAPRNGDIYIMRSVMEDGSVVTSKGIMK